MMIRYLDLYLLYLRFVVKKWEQYRADFFVTFASLLLLNGSKLLFLGVIFSNLRQLEGWSFYEMLLIWGLAVTVTSLAGTFLDIPHRINLYIQQGELDRLLVRPIDPLFQIGGEGGINLPSLGTTLIGMVATATALTNLAPQLKWWSLLYLPISIISGVLIHFSVQLIMACLGFWVVNTVSFMQTMSWMGQFGQYPINIFALPLQFLFTWILPYSMMGFYPVAFLLRGEEYQLYGLLIPLMGLFFWGLAILVWHLSLQQYQSTGS